MHFAADGNWGGSAGEGHCCIALVLEMFFGELLISVILVSYWGIFRGRGRNITIGHLIK